MGEDEQRQRLEMQDSEALSFCPSFSSCSSDRFAEIAAKVTEEFHAGEPPSLDTSNDPDDDFEFSFVRSDPEVMADEIFGGSQIPRIFPIFNRDLLIHDNQDQHEDDKRDVSSLSTLRLPLKKLFIEDREERDAVSSSSSSSEVEELEGVPSGSYCVWRPSVVEASPSRCKKSNSTGSQSKWWKLRDLVRRSNSEGKDSFVFLTPKNREQKAEKFERVENSKERRNSGNAVKGSGTVKQKGVAGDGGKKVSSPAHELFYVRNRAWKEGDKRKSFLPYRQDLVGFFANVNGLGRAFPTF